MKDASKKNKIGFILRSIHFGSSLKLWRRLSNYATQYSGSFFVFPGGTIDEQKNSEKFRNEIYKLVNSENLDGIISWSSSIGGERSSEEIEKFHSNFNNIPFITIGRKIGNNINVSFDAYSGMKELVLHFINTHDVKRIAFLRGPKNHLSANERFKGFMDALAETKLESYCTEELISDYFNWDEGEKAISQLFDDRNLIPGKDFDALFAASDLMAFSAVNWLAKKGYKIPKDYIVGSFNDSVESHVNTIPFSTVAMPMGKIGITAYDKLLEVINGNPNIEDLTFKTHPIIRESCGCNSLKQIVAIQDQRKRIKTRDQLIEEFVTLFNASENTKEKIFIPLFDALFENNQSEFFRLLSENLVSFFERDGELSYLFSAIKIFYNSNCLPEEYIDKIVHSVCFMIPKIQGQISARKLYEYEKLSSIISALKTELLTVHNKNNLIKILAEYFPQIGINNATIVLYENEEFSRYIGGFNSSGEVRTEEVLFPSKLLVPVKFAKEFEYGTYVVQPLYIGTKSLGYIITGYSDCDGNIYEDFRTSISNTIESISLFEETNSAKQIAERAEFAKTEFFANVGSDLCDPLKELYAKLSQMENNINNGIFNQDIVGEQIIFLKSQIESQIQKTQTLVDLTRSQVNDLPMDKKLFHVRQILPGSTIASINYEIPLLYGDSERINRALQTIFEIGEAKMSVTPKYDGVHINIETKRLDWHKPDLLLAEKIILLQYGEIIKKDDRSTTIILPWPNLAGLPPIKQENNNSIVFNLSAKDYDSQIYSLDVKNGIKDLSLIDENSCEQPILLWNPDNAPIDEWVKIYGLRRNEKLFRSPIICFSHELIGHNFVEVLEQKVRTQKSSPVLFVNSEYKKFGTWATEANSVSIESMAEFDNILSEITPSLIVFESVNEETIKKIRKNSKTVLVPILVLPESVLSEEEVELLCSHPRIILCNRGAAESEQFNERIHAILAGDEILPPHTGALVKKAILYLNKNASQQIVRWKLADNVHVSEDYLTRIFHKEIGLSLWEYLNRYRIYLATKMLLETNDTIYEIAEKSGFQDQAYFCRVFKKIYGIPPGKIRSKQ